VWQDVASRVSLPHGLRGSAPSLASDPEVVRQSVVEGIPQAMMDKGSPICPHPPISAAIICYNEEDNIGRCVDALDWCEQTIVVDSDSTDRTLDIVRQYPNTKLLQRPFDNFINQKNYALDHCDHEWVLSVDADEVLTAPLIEEIQSLPYDVEGYHIGRRSYLGDQEIKHGTWSPDYQLRLFRRSCARWGGSNPHENVILSGQTQRMTFS